MSRTGSWVPDRYRELRSRLRPDRIEDDVDEELQAHLEMRAADLEGRGLSADAAREEALRRFGDLHTWRTQTCAIDESIIRERRRMEIIDSIRRETRHSLRSLKRAPIFTIVAVVTLGLGIGATTAIFTLLDSIVLRPLPYPAPDQLVQVRHAVPLVQEGQEWDNSVANYFYYADNNRAFESVGAALRSTFSISGDGDAERITGSRVSASLFEVLGARTAHGRLFGEEEDTPGADEVAVLSHELWRTRYGADPAIIGRSISVNASPVTVVGVMEPGFTLPNHATRIWLPLQLDRSAPPVNSHYVPLYARLRTGVTPSSAQDDLARLTQQLPEQIPGAYSAEFFARSGFSVAVHPVRSMVLGAYASRFGIDRVLWLLLGAVSLVLLIACANVANLMLVRAEGRRREQTVRAALGAERAHFAVQGLTESTLVAAAGGLLGVGLAYLGIRVLVAIAPATLPRLGDVALSTNSIVFAVGLSLVTALIFGGVPVLRARTNFAELRESGRGATASRERQVVRGSLVVAQVAMALMLLSAGGLMLKTFFNLRDVRSGLQPQGVLTFNVVLPYVRYSEEPDVFRFQQELVQRVEALPGVERVSAASGVPLSGSAGCAHTVGEGSTHGGCVPVVLTLPGYFDALGIPVRGRALTWRDHELRSDQAVISRALAERLWPGEDPMGRRIISYQDGPPWFTIAGVADDVLADGLDRPPVQAVYYLTRRPEAEGYWGPHGARNLTFIARTSLQDPATVTSAVRTVLREMDPEVPLSEVRTMHDIMMSSERMARTTFTMSLLGIAAVVSLFLSAVGLYGVIGYLVGRRRAEIGVRMALGARVGQVARMVIVQSVLLTAAGIALGLVGSVIVARALASLVWGVAPTDPLTLLAVSALLLTVAVLASALPARRAARTDPSEALRSE